jgi:transcriptional regulator with XRE-family HTH domain
MDKVLVANRLYTLRTEKAKLSQIQFSEKIGVKQNNYTLIEKGDLSLTAKHLYNIGVHFGGAAVLFVLGIEY